MENLEHALDLVWQAERLLDDATDYVPENTDDTLLWRAIELLKELGDSWDQS